MTTSVMASTSVDGSFAALRQFARKRLPAERCELCSAGLGRDHSHLLELATRQIVCACEACATLFDGIKGGKYRRVSRRTWRLQDFHISDGQWEDLLIPINMAFFFYSSLQDRVVTLYPSPAGAVESQLPSEAWSEIVRENPLLHQLEPDIEALLVNRVGHAHASLPAEYYFAPIDECYRLVGLIRTHWKGLSGGEEVWQEIAGFFLRCANERTSWRVTVMPDLTFTVQEASSVAFAAVPTLAFKLHIENSVADEAVHTVALRCQIQIEASRRRYTAAEQRSIVDLFGEPERWSQTLRSLLWTHVMRLFQASLAPQSWILRCPAASTST